MSVFLINANTFNYFGNELNVLCSLVDKILSFNEVIIICMVGWFGYLTG